ncbi:MAG: HEAT repeat domain-containing protein [Candidatus Binatia bacterium]|nr:HEAT repeat domain-containing protein [Candidatus Binatia bacterium]
MKRQVNNMRTLEEYEKDLTHNDWAIRWDATYAIGRIGGERAVELLKRALSDPSAMVRLCASKELTKIDHKPY